MTGSPKFKVGQLVYLNAGSSGRQMGSRDLYEIVRLMPTERDDPQYRIKSSREPYERVAQESQLDRRSSNGGDQS